MKDPEPGLLRPFLEDYEQLVADFKAKFGNPILPNGERKMVIVMVANAGVIDLLLNFVCSAEEIKVKHLTSCLLITSI